MKILAITPPARDIDFTEGRNEPAYCFSGITFLRRNRTDALGKSSAFRAFLRRGIMGG